MTDKYDFETEFSSDAEVDDALDQLTLDLAEAIAEDESRTSVLNPFRMRELIFTYKVMRYLARGTRAKVTYKLNEPFQSMGSVSVTGKKIAIRNAEWFLKAVQLASNFESYPKTDGTVCMTFTFHNLTVPIE